MEELPIRHDSDSSLKTHSQFAYSHASLLPIMYAASTLPSQGGALLPLLGTC
jgi:hypothetical protein